MEYSLSRITTNGKTIILAYDQGLEHGPTDFNDENIDPNKILEIGSLANLNGIVLQKGIAEKYYLGSAFQTKIPLIVKLNGKTRFINNEPYAPQICSVDEAVKLGASAVGYTVYIGSERQDLMFKEFSVIEREAHNRGLPVIMWAYPRGKGVDDADPDVIAYGARVALELGADMVKVKYTGDPKSFAWVVKSAGKTLVVMSGGPKVENVENFYQQVKEAMSAGACGVVVGRNIWQAQNPLEVAERLREIVFGVLINL